MNDNNGRRAVLEAERPDPRALVTQLLQQPLVAADRVALAPRSPRALALLESEAAEMVDYAAEADLMIEYVGVESLFRAPRLYRGVDTDWVLGPATRESDLVVPRKEQAILRQLAEEGLHFPLTYIAHEVRREDVARVVPSGARADAPVTLMDDEAADIVGPTPPPAATADLGARLARRAGVITSKAGRFARNTAMVTGAAAAGVVAAPVILVGGALAALATLDPIILGALPAASEEPGAPAAWFILARWDWEVGQEA